MATRIERAKHAYQQVREFWERDMWQHDAVAGMSPVLGGLAVFLGRATYIVVDAFRQDRIRLRAATLTFVTLLSLVPLLAVAFSLFTAFGGLQEVGDKVKELVVDALAVQQREVVVTYLDKFIEGANAGGLGVIGSATLFVTAVTTLANIETAFNDIWGVAEARGWLRRFQVYLPIVTLGPVLLGVAFSSVLAMQSSDAVKSVLTTAPMLKMVFGLGPVVLYTLLFTGLYLIVPNTRVRIGPGLAGGVVAGVCWVIGQQVFTVYAGRAISYSAIYGSFGAVPLTILWIYIAWTLVLLGATVSFAVQSAGTYEPERGVAWREQEHVAGRLVVEIARRFDAGEGPTADQELIDNARVPARLGRQLLARMVERGLLVRVVLDDDDTGFAPGKPLSAMSLADVVDGLRGDPPDVAWVGGPLLDGAEALEREALARRSLQDLASERSAVGPTAGALGNSRPSPPADPSTPDHRGADRSEPSHARPSSAGTGPE